jgi:hypothetical protein
LRPGSTSLVLPHLLEAEHVLEPQQHRLHRLEVRGDVIDVLEAVRVDRPGSGRHRLGAGPQRAEAAALAEPERAVAERRRDRELAQRAAVVGERLDVVDRRAAALLEQRERPRDVLDLEHQRADAVGVLRQEAVRAAALADRRRAHDLDVAGGEARRALAAVALELGGRAPRLGEAELAAVEALGAREVADVPVDPLEALDSNRRDLRHHDLTASGC